ncbi:hypothetical protein [Nonomuraea aurantiaca]|uniref:hypothetical protein n=1 Tax=Nonomuraea aurantiaca TaxID=2878562 RepID=UPI001CD9E1AA|nr:hypothetical protein [Nonomuraea aurantiaca]MCA2223772.1 hypothetical protein [Nonomuraea aurantiaca]
MTLIRAELLKLRTTRLWWVMLGVTVAYVLLQLGLTIGFAGQAAQNGRQVFPAGAPRRSRNSCGGSARAARCSR